MPALDGNVENLPLLCSVDMGLFASGFQQSPGAFTTKSELQAAGQGLTGLLTLGNTAFAGMAAAMNSTASMMAAGLQPLAQARNQVNAALQNATGITVPADIGPAATIAANAQAALVGTLSCASSSLYQCSPLAAHSLLIC